MLQHKRMIDKFGRYHLQEACKHCSNFQIWNYRGKKYFKCERYGLSHSISTDWRANWQACGMFNVPLPCGERPLIEYSKVKKESVVLENQTSLFDACQLPEVGNG